MNGHEIDSYFEIRSTLHWNKKKSKANQKEIQNTVILPNVIEVKICF